MKKFIRVLASCIVFCLLTSAGCTGSAGSEDKETMSPEERAYLEAAIGRVYIDVQVEMLLKHVAKLHETELFAVKTVIAPIDGKESLSVAFVVDNLKPFSGSLMETADLLYHYYSVCRVVANEKQAIIMVQYLSDPMLKPDSIYYVSEDIIYDIQNKKEIPISYLIRDKYKGLKLK